MAELNPFPFGRLVARMFRELEKRQSIFDLPAKKFFLGDPAKDLSVKFHGLPASTPLGPAAGPHSQLAQNIVLSWLGGSRIMELKTVQIVDDLKIPRPCIDMHNVGYNVEWSQELRLRQSLEEYVKAAMLIEILAKSGKLPLASGFTDVIYDMSVGYDLKGIQSEPVQAFMRGMRDARSVVDRFRKEIPAEFKQFRDLDYPTELSKTLTLSTFHGCPPNEIEKIIDYLLKSGLHCVIKFNPTLLGPAELRRLLHEKLGYKEMRTPDASFEKDTKWEQSVAMVGRLKETAKSLGLTLGGKFSNTLIVENHKTFFAPDNKEMYMSGPPLHVLAMNLVRRFRAIFANEVQISFAAGIDRFNAADAVSLGLTPITVCSDLLKTGGYARLETYFREIVKRMDAAGASTIGDFVLKAHGKAAAALPAVLRRVDDGRRAEMQKVLAAAAGGSPVSRPAGYAANSWGGAKRETLLDAVRAAAKTAGYSAEWADLFYSDWCGEAALMNTDVVVPKLEDNPRYAKAENSREPQKLGSKLDLFNCVTCDKCVQVCPNDANFTYILPEIEIPVEKLAWRGGKWEKRGEGKLVFNKKHQIGNFADFCNECGNCDVYCPEDGGPYIVKPRFFGSVEKYREFPGHDGFVVEKTPSADKVHARFKGKEFVMTVGRSGEVLLENGGISVAFSADAPASPKLNGQPPADGTELDFTYFHIMNWFRKALLSENEVNYLNV